MDVELSRRKPDLGELPAIEVERLLAEKFTRIRERGEGYYSAELCVGVHGFSVVEGTDLENATWYCWMLSKALVSLLTTEGKMPIAEENNAEWVSSIADALGCDPRPAAILVAIDEMHAEHARMRKTIGQLRHVPE